MDAVVRYSLRAEGVEYENVDQLNIIWNVDGPINVDLRCDIERLEPTEEVVDGHYSAARELVRFSEYFEYQFPAPAEPDVSMEPGN